MADFYERYFMTVNEIAKLANTSPATVSLALNNKPGVSPATRERILKIVSEHGYIPRKKSTPQSNQLIKLVAVSKPNSSNIHNFRTSFFAEITNYIQRRCSELGYSMLYSIIPHEDFIRDVLSDESRQLSSGIILIGTYLDEKEVEMTKQLSVPFIILDRGSTLTSVNTVNINNYRGAYRAVEELIQSGHREIGYIRSSSLVFNLQERFHGFSDALERNGLILDKACLFQCNSYIDNGVDILKEQLENCNSLPTAFFCENDYVAFALISALNKMGLSTPGDISVIGFDDVPECIMTTPQLTTLHVDRKALAYAAVNRLNEILNTHGSTTQSIMVDTTLVRRNSVSPVSITE